MNIDFQFAPCALAEVYDFVVLNHYSHSCPNAGIVSHAFSAKIGDILVGAAVFAHKAGNAESGSIFKEPFNTSEDCRELIRLVMDDVLPKNSESRFIGWCLRYLRSNSNLLGLLSYADPAQKNPLTGKPHDGMIYRATCWLYTGLSNPIPKFIVDGEEIHRRRATNLYGTASAAAIRAMGHTVEVRTAKPSDPNSLADSPKHRYIYLLQAGMLPFVKYPILKFGALVLVMALTCGIASMNAARRELRKFAKWFMRRAGAA